MMGPRLLTAILVAMLLTITLIGFSSCAKYEEYADPYTTVLRFLYDKAKDKNTVGQTCCPAPSTEGKNIFK